MQIYFTAYPRTSKQSEVINECKKLLQRRGYKIADIADLPKKLTSLDVIKSSDIFFGLICEVSEPFLKELSFAKEQGKVVVVLYESGILDIEKSIHEENIVLQPFKASGLEESLAKALDRAISLASESFVFSMSPQILKYVNWMSDEKSIPRATFLRSLIEEKMLKDAKYKQHLLG